MNYREYFSQKLGGRGAEIGALHNPSPRHDRMTVDTIDKLTVAEMRKHYPELEKFSLQEPNILDDAETLSSVEDSTYNFIIAAHVLEHVKDAIGSLENWVRVLRPEGRLYLIVPDHRKIFDKYRERTPLEHHIDDYRNFNEAKDFQHFYDYAENVHKKFFGYNVNVREEAERLRASDYSIHRACYIPEDLTNLLQWFSEHISPLKILEGPIPDGIEFHILAQKL